MVDSIFIHYLDMEFIKLFKLIETHGEQKIFEEFQLATRLACLLANQKIVIPASNYFESNIANKIINDIRPFRDLGYISLVSSSINMIDFINKKKEQYCDDTSRYPLYFQEFSKNGIILPVNGTWVKRNNSATEDISRSWIASIDNSETWEKFYKYSSHRKIEKFQTELSKIPDRLEDRAFIADYVLPLMPVKQDRKLYEKLENHINAVITKAYIESFLNEFNAVCIKDFSLFDTSPVLPNIGGHISFLKLKRMLYQKKMLHTMQSYSADKLLAFKSTDKWRTFIDELQGLPEVGKSKTTSIIRYLPKIFYFLKPYKSKSNEEEKKKMEIKSFIVHGHDDSLKLDLKNYLQNTLKLPEPIILHEQPSRGKTIIEKFESVSSQVNLVFVLLTPDDVYAEGGENGEIRRARQNVIFEMGYFMGKMGRGSGRVILLYKGRLDLPSDISGVIYINVSNGISASGEDIRREIADLIQ